MESRTEPVQVPVEKLRKYLLEYRKQMSTAQNDIERNKLGQILTIIDASFADQNQRKAVKDLVNNMWYISSGWFNSYKEVGYIAEALCFKLDPDEVQTVATPFEGTYNRYLEIK